MDRDMTEQEKDTLKMKNATFPETSNTSILVKRV